MLFECLLVDTITVQTTCNSTLYNPTDSDFLEIIVYREYNVSSMLNINSNS